MVEIENQTYYTVSEVSKIVGIKKVGRNKFFELLRLNGVLLTNNFLSQTYLNLDMGRMHGVMRNGKTYYIPVFSEKGVNYIEKKVASGEFQIGFEKYNKKVSVVNLNDIC